MEGADDSQGKPCDSELVDRIQKVVREELKDAYRLLEAILFAQQGHSAHKMHRRHSTSEVRPSVYAGRRKSGQRDHLDSISSLPVVPAMPSKKVVEILKERSGRRSVPAGSSGSSKNEEGEKAKKKQRNSTGTRISTGTRNSRRSATSSLSRRGIAGLYDGLMGSRRPSVGNLEDFLADSLMDDLEQGETVCAGQSRANEEAAVNEASDDPDSCSSHASSGEGALSDGPLPNLIDGASALPPVKDQNSSPRASEAQVHWPDEANGSLATKSMDASRKLSRLDRMWATRDEKTLHTDRFDVHCPVVAPMDSLTSFNQKSPMDSASELILRCAGMIPTNICRSSYMHPTLTVALCFACAGLFIRAAIISSEYMFWSSMMAAMQASGIGCALAMLHTSCIKDLIGPRKTPLRDYAIQHNFYDDLIMAIPFDAAAPISLFVIGTIIHTGFPEPFPSLCADRQSSAPVWHLIVCQTWIDFVFAAIMYVKIRISRFLEMMVDDYCSWYVEHRDIYTGFVEWNRIQAILNRAAKRLDNSYVVLLTSLLMGLGPIAADILVGLSANGEGTTACSGPAWNWRLRHLLAIMTKATVMFFALANCAKVSQKCGRTKCFINSLFDGRRNFLDAGRSQLVRYIDDSNAGFHINGVKVTSFALMKGAYMMGALIFALVVQAVKKYGH
eukprot:TRINITY_DN56649_c0_g1_i1.p1 TRINITY_DN56649_c0_g1~~TRINITY_DN56649_c0_g1_i1.p1  ORF type:complete len:673 (+),score=88.98 TRINITY_DN56649_c0_g1_i1:65-2083(+)